MTKSQTQEYIDKEEATLRRPVEIYHIWGESAGIAQDHYRYTSGDVDVIFNGNVYSTLSIERGSISYDSKLEISTLSIQITALDEPVIKYLARNAFGVYWVEVLKLFRDQDPYEANVIFLGQIKNVSFQGVQGNIECTGFESYLNRTIPKFRYQTSCNHMLYDNNCNIDKTLYSLNATLTDVRNNGLQLSSPTFGTKPNDWFTFGYAESGINKRMITYHVSSVIKLRYALPDLAIGSAITVYAGCDLTPETCRDKFDNLDNSLLFPYIPLDSPVTSFA